MYVYVRMYVCTSVCTMYVCKYYVGTYVVGIATCYVLDGPGIENRWGRDFSQPSRTVVGPNHRPVQCVPGFCSRTKATGAWR
jgi:hypothetical protein